MTGTPEPRWIATPHLRPDHGGPVDRPYTPFVDLAVAPGLLHLLTQVAEPRDRTAIDDDTGATTYGELLSAIAALAARLQQATALAARLQQATGPAAEGPVAVLLPSGAAHIAAVLACVAIGRPCLLLDTGFPDARNEVIAETARAGLVVVADDREHALELAARPVLRIPRRVAQLPSAAAGTGEADGGPGGLDEVAIILCTSGSTGQPKPIAHSQRTLLQWVRTFHDSLHLTREDRVLTLSSFASLGGINGWLYTLLAGGRLRVLDIARGGLGALHQALQGHMTTILRATPSLMRAFGRHPGARSALAGLRAVQTYGEPMTRAELAEWQPLLPPGCLVRCTYGSTEANGFAGFARADDPHDPVRLPAGCLFPDTMAAIVDDDGRDVAVGEEGELWIRGRYNALGEWVDGRLVPGRLLPHPSGDGTRVYRTGDLARLHPDGVFVVLGRRDRMLKVNGQRLEPAEVERVLRAHPSVLEAEVVGHAVDGSATRLVAFVVPRPARPPSDDLGRALREHAASALPAFMVPARVVVIEALPRLPGGKVDRAALMRQAAAPRTAG